MDVPFISSGAMSRAQYTLVRKVENAASLPAADQILLNELDDIRRNLQQPHLSINHCKECLILILHCAMSLTTSAPGDLEFAFPHAVNLAEFGQSPMDKKIGYIFCVELMPPNHELQLMLVNTLRKDLESSSVSRICLALDVLTQVPNEDAIPAVDTRLQALLQHESSSVAVRRRSLAAYCALFRRDSERMAHLEDVIQRHLWFEPSGIRSTSAIAGKIKHSESLEKFLNLQLQYQYRQSNEASDIFSILRALRGGGMKLEPDNVPVILDVIQHASKVPVRSVLRDAFMLLSSVNLDVLRESQFSSMAVTSIRHFLSSRDPNDVYLFVSCLSCLDPSVWAGTYPNTTAVLDEWEVQAVMRFLDSPDGLIRKTTLKILHSVDPTIVETWYSQALHNLSPSRSLSEKNEIISRLLEIVDMQDRDDTDQYAKRLKDILLAAEGTAHGAMENLPVLDLSVEHILNEIRERETSFRMSCVTALAVPLTEHEVRVGPTMMVVVSALVSENCGKISISPLELLRGMATRLHSYAPSIQDACLLTMLRLSVECDTVPEQVTSEVRLLSQHAGAYLRRRCEQFLKLSTQRRVLAEIISRAPSSSLPDFLFALTNYQSKLNATPPQSPRRVPSSRQDQLESPPGRGIVSLKKLRYEAYAAPQPVPSLRHLSSPRRSRGSISSPEGSTRSLSRASDAPNSSNELAKTITPGELTLVAAQNPLYPLEDGRTLEPVARPPKEDLVSRVDLITLDSPFIMEPAKEESTDADFKVAWDSMENSNGRGWCEVSLDAIVRLLQSLQYRMRVIATDQPPFEGELKVLVQAPEPSQVAALRLREGEDESCLWRLRCDDLELRTSIKKLIEDI